MEKGPVRILCDEIEFPFERRLETVPILVAFVARLVHEVASGRAFEERISHLTGKPPSAASAEAVRLAEAMLTGATPEEIIAGAKKVHDFGRVRNPDEGPSDHTLDMLSSCASALRFGLEQPCVSRHAASAAGHIWRRKYGVTLHDDLTPHWEKHWARVQLQNAITDLALSNRP